MKCKVQHDLSFALRAAACSVHKITLQALKTLDLTPRQYCVLVMLGQGSVMQSELVETLHLNANSVANETNVLEDRRLIRKRRDPQNRRKHTINIEEKGL